MTGIPGFARGLALGAGGLALVACAETQLVVHAAKQVGSSREAPAEAGKPLYKIGAPYEINGVWYYPAVDYDYDETGIASWYGPQFHARATANGEIFDMNQLSVAHRTLPMPSFVRVTNLENGRSLNLRVNDRGPFAHGRIADLSRRAAQLLGFEQQGTARVRVQILGDESRAIAARFTGRTELAAVGSPITVGRLPKPVVTSEALAPPAGSAAAPPPAAKATGTGGGAADSRPPASPRRGPEEATAEPRLGVVSLEPVRPTAIFVQAGAFSFLDNASRVSTRLAPVGDVNVTSIKINGKDLFRVRVGPFASVDAADLVLDRVIKAGYPAARIIVE